jgi:hypothetical protein
VRIHHSLEAGELGTRVDRWPVLDIAMPVVARPLRRALTSRFDRENARTINALKACAEA